MKFKTTLTEWVKGDFSERNKRIQAERWMRNKLTSQNIKPKSQLSRIERMQELFSEWVLGDFSKRDARAKEKRQKEFREMLKKSKSSIKGSPKLTGEAQRREKEVSWYRQQAISKREIER